MAEKTSAQRKFDRGIEHTAVLIEELKGYEAGGAYTFDLEREPRDGGVEFCRIFATEQLSPPDHWPLLAGEAIQNFRAALDHSIWASWRSDPGNAGDGNHTGFPIALDPATFRENSRRLKGVPAPVRAAVERLQPYAGGFAQAPEYDPLAILNRLSNIDKHRSLTAIASAVEMAAIGHDGAQGAITGWEHGTFELGHGRTEVGSFTAAECEPTAHVRVRGADRGVATQVHRQVHSPRL